MLVWIFTLFIVLQGVQGVEVFVQSSGSDEADCLSMLTACRTLRQALSALHSAPLNSHLTVSFIQDNNSILAEGTCGLGVEDFAFLDVLASQSLTLRGINSVSAPAKVSIDCQNQNRFAVIKDTSTLIQFQSLSFTNGFVGQFTDSGANGGFFLLDQGVTVEFDHCEFSNGFCQGTFSTAVGGAIFCGDATIRVVDCRFFNHSAAVGGSIASRKTCNATLLRIEVEKSSADAWSGAFSFDDEATTVLKDSWIHDCYSIAGAAIDDGARAVTFVENCLFTDNTALIGAVYYSYGRSTMHFQNCTMTNNTAFDQGGALFVNSQSTVTLTGCVIERSTAQGLGGALNAGPASYLRITNTVWRENIGAGGGAISLVAGLPVEIVGNTFENNVARSEGGGAIAIAQTRNEPGVDYALILSNCTFSGNTAPQGGAIFTTTSVSLEDANKLYLHDLNLVRNRALKLDGGGLLAKGHSTIFLIPRDPTASEQGTPTSFLSNNFANRYGGAISLTEWASLTTTQLSLSGNEAFAGGALQMSLQASAEIDRCLIENNRAPLGAGVHLIDAANLTLKQSAIRGGRARLGGAMFLDQDLQANNCFECDHSVFFSENSASASGGAIFWEVRPLLNPACTPAFSSCTLERSAANQAASYGDDYASGPYRFVETTLRVENEENWFFGAPFVIEATLQDQWNQTVTKSSSEYAVTLGVRSAATEQQQVLLGPALVIPSDEGTVRFHGRLAVHRDLLSSSDQLLQSKSSAGLRSVFNQALLLKSTEEIDLSKEITEEFDQSKEITKDIDLSKEITKDIDLSKEITKDIDLSKERTLSSRFGFTKAKSNRTVEVLLFLQTEPSSVKIASFQQKISTQCPPGYRMEPLQSPLENYTACFEVKEITETGLIVLGIANGVLIVITVMSFIWIYSSREERVVKTSDFRMNLLVLAGLLVCLIAAYMWFDNNNAMCGLRPWLLALGMSIIYPSLVLKQYRLFYVFRRSRKFKGALISFRHMIAFIALIQLIPSLVILIVWFAVSPYDQREYVDYEQFSVSFLCGSEISTLDTVMISLLLALSVIILLAGTLLSLLSRHIFSNYNEALWLGICMYALGIGLAACTPLVIIYSNDVNAQFLVPVITILGVAACTLFAILYPKMFYVYFPKSALRQVAEAIEEIDGRLELLGDKSHHARSMESLDASTTIALG